MSDQVEPSKGAWTPGPWKVEQGRSEDDFIVTEPSGNTVCEPNAPLFADYTGLDESIRKIPLAEALANAKLMSKAPQMADLLRELMMLETPTTRNEIARFVVLRSKAERLLTDLEVKP